MEEREESLLDVGSFDPAYSEGPPVVVDAAQAKSAAGPLFLRESIERCWDEAAQMVAANHAETGFESVEKFHPLRDFYVQQERAGIAKLFTMRHAGKLTGYQVFLVYPHPDHDFELSASQRTLFVYRDHRGIEAAHFMRYAHGELARDGVKHLARQVRVCGPDYSDFLLADGFVEVERVFVKVL